MRFSIRDLLWLMVVAALVAMLWVERSRNNGKFRMTFITKNIAERMNPGDRTEHVMRNDGMMDYRIVRAPYRARREDRPEPLNEP